jgi:hypothetical protein
MDTFTTIGGDYEPKSFEVKPRQTTDFRSHDASEREEDGGSRSWL